MWWINGLLCKKRLKTKQSKLKRLGEGVEQSLCPGFGLVQEGCSVSGLPPVALHLFTAQGHKATRMTKG